MQLSNGSSAVVSVCITICAPTKVKYECSGCLCPCMQVHALVTFGPASNIIARLGWFSSIKYRIGSQEYSANDIEHGVLRNNKPSPASLLSLIGLSGYAPKTFQPGDPRLSQVMIDSASTALA